MGASKLYQRRFHLDAPIPDLLRSERDADLVHNRTSHRFVKTTISCHDSRTNDFCITPLTPLHPRKDALVWGYVLIGRGLVGLDGAAGKRNLVRDIFLTFGDFGSVAYAMYLWAQCSDHGEICLAPSPTTPTSKTAPGRQSMTSLFGLSFIAGVPLYTFYQVNCIFLK
jgi:hypothetical protein